MRVRIRCKDKKLRAKIRRAVLRHRLDRRKVYEMGFDGELATQARCTMVCSGCSCDCSPDYGCSHGGYGCKECGYTARRVFDFPDPVEVRGKFIRIAPSQTLTPEMFHGGPIAQTEQQP